MDDRDLYRWGGAAAVIGAVVALVTNLLHPRISDYENYVGETLAKVAMSDAWIPIHLGLLLGTLLIVVGLFAFARSMKGGPADGLARLGLGAVLVAAPVAVATLLVDGYATKQIAEAVAAGGDQTAGAAVLHVAWALFAGLIILFVGVAPALLGLAAARSGIYPAWLGWAAVILGVVAVADGFVAAWDGPSAGFFLVFIATSGLLTLWVLVLGVLVGRRARVSV
jgi:hypothetical protein